MQQKKKKVEVKMLHGCWKSLRQERLETVEKPEKEKARSLPLVPPNVQKSKDNRWGSNFHVGYTEN